MQIPKKYIAKWIPPDRILPLLTMIAVQFLSFSATRPIVARLHHYNLETVWDMQIPFLPWTVLIYVACFAYWIVSILLILRGDRDLCYRFLISHLLSAAIATVVFLVFPTTNTRPEFEVTNLWEWGMAFIYWIDSPENQLPSYHCLLSWLCFRSAAKEPAIPKGYAIFSGVFTVLVCISTLTTKQHVIADVVSGLLLAELVYQISGNRKVTRFYYKIFDKK